MDEIKKLRTFIKVVDTGSFTGAARDVASVSSVARQIRALEEELGARLLNRNSRRISLTEAGQRLYDRGQAIVADLEAVRSEVVSMQEDAKGTIRASIRMVAGMVVVAPALPKLLQKYPELQVDLVLTDERLDFISNQIDVAIWMGELPNNDYVARKLARTKRKLCASPAYLQRRGMPQHPSELIKHDCLRYTARAYGPKWSFRRGEEVVEVPIKGSVRADNGLVLQDLALQGMGLVSTPYWMSRQPLANGDLVEVLPEWEVNPVESHAEYFAVFPSSRGMSKKVRVFVDFLVQTFAEANTTPAPK